MKIEFLGASGGEVTGSKFLITTVNRKKILIDCGMYQGKGLETDAMNRDLGFEPVEIDYLILSHAHIDHSGLIPYIFKNGFKGKVFCTPATRDLCAIMLADSGKIQEADTRQFNKKRVARNLPIVEPIYTMEDAAESMGLFVSVPYNMPFDLIPGCVFEFKDTGHILGGASIFFTFTEGEETKTLLYTSDVGRYHKKILKDPCKNLPQAENKLMMIVKDACAKRKGKLIIPSFAIGRTQEIVYALNRLYNDGNLPDVEIFVDSPLAVSATDIFRLHTECFNQDMRDYMQRDPDPFGFDNLHYIRTIDESKRLNNYNQPCVIVSASGMMEAGRVKHHLANNINNPRTTILCVGYCSPKTLGARIMRGDHEVSIFGTKYSVKAQLERIDSFSGHGDYKELLRYLESQDPKQVKQVFVVHGEDESREAFAEHLHDAGFKKTYIPALKEAVEI